LRALFIEMRIIYPATGWVDVSRPEWHSTAVPQSCRVSFSLRMRV
jgi:hypothetical protein